MLLAHPALPAHDEAIWWFIGLVLLIVFVTLVATDGSKDKEE